MKTYHAIRPSRDPAAAFVTIDRAEPTVPGFTGRVSAFYRFDVIRSRIREAGVLSKVRENVKFKV